MRDSIREAIERARLARDEGEGTTKSATGRFVDRKRDYIDAALDELAMALREVVEADVIARPCSTRLEIGPLGANGEHRAFIRFELEDGAPGMGDVVHVSARWDTPGGHPQQIDERRSIDEIDRERVDDYLERLVPAVLEGLARR
jgi:hypothetical protein